MLKGRGRVGRLDATKTRQFGSILIRGCAGEWEPFHHRRMRPAWLPEDCPGSSERSATSRNKNRTSQRRQVLENCAHTRPLQLQSSPEIEMGQWLAGTALVIVTLVMYARTRARSATRWFDASVATLVVAGSIIVGATTHAWQETIQAGVVAACVLEVSIILQYEIARTIGRRSIDAIANDERMTETFQKNGLMRFIWANAKKWTR